MTQLMEAEKARDAIVANAYVAWEAMLAAPPAEKAAATTRVVVANRALANARRQVERATVALYGVS
jgi:hypothetical protein